MASAEADDVPSQDEKTSPSEIGVGAVGASAALEAEAPDQSVSAEADACDAGNSTDLVQAGESLQDYGKLSWFAVQCDTEVIRAEGPPNSNRYRCVCLLVMLVNGPV